VTSTAVSGASRWRCLTCPRSVNARRARRRPRRGRSDEPAADRLASKLLRPCRRAGCRARCSLSAPPRCRDYAGLAQQGIQRRFGRPRDEQHRRRPNNWINAARGQGSTVSLRSKGWQFAARAFVSRTWATIQGEELRRDLSPHAPVATKSLVYVGWHALLGDTGAARPPRTSRAGSMNLSTRIQCVCNREADARRTHRVLL
jgi:hypothetical protein